MTIRSFTPADKPSLLALLDLNIPDAFAPSEAADFRDYLDEQLEDYFVVEENGALLAGGGINYFPETREARLSWDMVHPDHRSRGLGSRLVRHRIERIGERPWVDRIVVRTSQLAWRFYEKQGFSLVKKKKDFWAEGYDLYEMWWELPEGE